MKLKEIIAALERLAPPRLQEEWDNSGLQVGFPETEVSRVLVCLDITEAIVDHEEVSLVKWAGVLLIMAGCYLIAK